MSKPHLDAELLCARERLLVHPAHVLLLVGIKVFARPLRLPLYELGPFDAVRRRPAENF